MATSRQQAQELNQISRAANFGVFNNIDPVITSGLMMAAPVSGSQTYSASSLVTR